MPVTAAGRLQPQTRPKRRKRLCAIQEWSPTQADWNRSLAHTCGKLALALLATFVFASAGAQSYTAARVEFSDKGTFTQAQLEKASELHAGSSFTQAQLGEAAQRLVDTGYFADMSASLEGPVKSVAVKFTDKPVSLNQMLHVGFLNFVWLTQDEIEAAISARFPLFIDYLPENSPQQDVLKAALTEALAAKSINAQVAYETFEPTLNHSQRELVFEIKEPSIKISNIRLSGVSTALVPFVQKSVNSTARTRYIVGPADETSYDRILAPLLDAGYAAATLTSPSAAPAIKPDGSVDVVISAQLTPRAVYKVSSLTFVGDPLLSAEAFAATATLHAGDLASRKSLIETLTPLDAAYRAKGYMDVVVDAHPALDPAAHSVSYTVTVQPGEQYRVHEITANNLTPAAKADFDRGFLMKPGELYNPAYITSFLKNNTALQALFGYSANFKAHADPAAHTVDVVIDFYRMTARPGR